MNDPALQSTTQLFLDIYDITNDVVILKNGATSIILSVNAINFGLLAEEEQDAVIYQYAALLNSLNFPIQVVVRSQTKDATTYLQLLKDQEDKTTDRVKRDWIRRYREFVSNLIYERNVLDKKFYVAIPASYLEMGLTTAQNLMSGFKDSSIEGIEKSIILEKALTILEPRRDHIISQFARIGLQARQLKTQEIIQLFYTSYNPEAAEGQQITDSRSYTTPLVQAQIRGVVMNDQQTALVQPVAAPTPPDQTAVQPQAIPVDPVAQSAAPVSLPPAPAQSAQPTTPEVQPAASDIQPAQPPVQSTPAETVSTQPISTPTPAAGEQPFMTPAVTTPSIQQTPSPAQTTPTPSPTQIPSVAPTNTASLNPSLGLGSSSVQTSPITNPSPAMTPPATVFPIETPAAASSTASSVSTPALVESPITRPPASPIGTSPMGATTQTITSPNISAAGFSTPSSSSSSSLSTPPIATPQISGAGPLPSSAPATPPKTAAPDNDFQALINSTVEQIKETPEEEQPAPDLASVEPVILKPEETQNQHAT